MRTAFGTIMILSIMAGTACGRAPNTTPPAEAPPAVSAATTVSAAEPPPSIEAYPGVNEPVAPAATAPAGAIENGSFEKQMNNWWHWCSRENEAEAFAEGGKAYAGSFHLVQRLKNPKDEVLSLVVQNVANPSGKRVVASGAIRAGAPEPLSGGAHAYIAIEFWRGGEKVGVSDSQKLRGEFPWTTVNIARDIPPEGVEEARILLVLAGPKGGSGAAYFDDITARIE